MDKNYPVDTGKVSVSKKEKPSKTSKSTSSNNNKINRKKKDSLDGWEVFKFQLREERRLNTEFNNIESFLLHWLNVNGCTKENGKLKQLYVNKRPHKETKAPQGLEGSDEKPKPPKGLQDFQKEASDRYGQLSHAEKALYRAVGKEYFIRTKSRH